MILSYILSPIFHLYYYLVFVFFHPILVVGHKLGGDKVRVKVIKALNTCLLKGLYILGSRIIIKGKENIPADGRPIVLVSNHQSLYDIAIIGYLFADKAIDFVSKASLGKGIPTVSYNLRNGQSALVHRDNGGQSVREIFKAGRYIEANNTAMCIYPEGTRSRTGKVKKFMPAGVATLLRAAPSAVVVPFAIKGHYELGAKSQVFLKFGQKIEYTILPPVEPKGRDMDELMVQLRTDIAAKAQN